VLFEWTDEKEQQLKKDRGLSFEDVVFHIQNGDILDITDHPNRTKYPNQKIMFLKMEDYVFMVLYVKEQKKFVLKTIIPSRKATNKYLRKT